MDVSLNLISIVKEREMHAHRMPVSNLFRLDARAHFSENFSIEVLLCVFSL